MKKHRWKDRAAFQAILQEIRTLENDRAAAIVAVAVVEWALVLAIEAHCSPMSNTKRKKLEKKSLDDLITTANTEGVIDQEAADHLNILRKIRNEFAHDMNPVSFASREILKLCKSLPVPNFQAGGAKLKEPKDTNKRMRRRFTEETWQLLLLLIG
jgi:uncharacterized protein YutE (UPF0331/DUF86 family)